VKANGERGSLSVFMIGFAFMGLALAGLLVDVSSMMNTYLRAADVAEQAARAGADAIDQDYLRETGQIRIVSADDACAKARGIVAQYGDPGIALLNCNLTDAQHVSVTVRMPWHTYFLAAFGVQGGTREANATAGAITGQGG
jgi:hypothetical protein